jgi:hypothetical protein
MFSKYTFVNFILFVYFVFFLESFFVFFEDIFLIIAFLSFLTILYQFIITSTAPYFETRAETIRSLYYKLFARRKEAITKNITLLQQIYVKQERGFIAQFAALFYLKHITGIKIQKAIFIAAETTATQNIFIEIQKQLTRELNAAIQIKYTK